MSANAKLSSSRVFVIGVCGGSGSGKTTFCNKLVDLLGPNVASHLRQDDYYKDLSHLSPEERAEVNFDHPTSLEFSLLARHIALLKSGKSVMVPCYNFATHSRKPVVQHVAPHPVSVVEGILLFADPEVEESLDLKIFIDTPEQVRFERRLRRDVRERGRTPESVEKQFARTVKPMHNEFVEPTKGRANFVFSGEVPFEPHLAQVVGVLKKPGVV
jgi:uridine kinase